MSRLTVTVWKPSGRAEVAASPTPVAGLVINEDNGVWAVTHAQSGAAVLKLPHPEAALHAAVQLGPLADWTLPGSTLRLIPGLDNQVWTLARELGCYLRSFGGAAISDDQMAEVEAGGAT